VIVQRPFESPRVVDRLGCEESAVDKKENLARGGGGIEGRQGRASKLGSHRGRRTRSMKKKTVPSSRCPRNLKLHPPMTMATPPVPYERCKVSRCSCGQRRVQATSRRIGTGAGVGPLTMLAVNRFHVANSDRATQPRGS